MHLQEEIRQTVAHLNRALQEITLFESFERRSDLQGLGRLHRKEFEKNPGVRLFGRGL